MRPPDLDVPSDGLCVQSDVLPDGSYGVSVALGQDHCWALDRECSVNYAVMCFRRATEAEHDVAVYRLLTRELGLPQEYAIGLIATTVRGRKLGDVPGIPLRFRTAMYEDGTPSSPLMLMV